MPRAEKITLRCSTALPGTEPWLTTRSAVELQPARRVGRFLRGCQALGFSNENNYSLFMGRKKLPLTDEQRAERRRLQAREWHNRNRDRVAEKRRANYACGALKEKKRSYYLENKPALLAKRKAHYEAAKSSGKYTADVGRQRRNMPAPTRPQPIGCEICTRELKPGAGTCLDHCHDTGKFRGWLCHRCNLSIGHLGDNAAGVRRALIYLERFEAEHVD